MILETEKANLFQPSSFIDGGGSLDVIEGNAADQVVKVTAPEQTKSGIQPKASVQPVADLPEYRTTGIGTLSDQITPGTSGSGEVCEFCEQWRPVGIFLAVLVVIFFNLRS